MNSVIQEYFPVFEMYQALRTQLIEMLNDADLTFQPGGANPTLGALCREMGEVQVAYIQSFKTFRQDFAYHHDEPNIENSVAKLSAWFAELDRELKETFAALSDEDLQSRVIDRGGGFTLSPRIQLEVYKEALLIFYGKASVYLKAMGKPLPSQWQEWIG